MSWGISTIQTPRTMKYHIMHMYVIFLIHSVRLRSLVFRRRILSLAPTMHANERKRNNDSNKTMVCPNNSAANLMKHVMTNFSAQIP